MSESKLVRDRIPEIIRAKGEEPKTRLVEGVALLQALKDKLVEEVGEARNAPADHLLEEIADVEEVLDALKRAAAIDSVELEQVRTQKRHERGGFEKGIILEQQS